MFETIALSVITALLFLLMLTRKPGMAKLLLGALTALSAAASLVLYVLMVKDSGGPDQGKELLQLYVPCGAYVLLAVLGAGTAALSSRKLRKEREAKRAVKAAKTKKNEP